MARYNEGATRVLLLSAAGGEGLDLKETDEVHVMEPHWNDPVVQQVIGRAVRFRSHADTRTVVRVLRYCSVLPRNLEGLAPPGHRGVRNILYKMTADQVLRELTVHKAQWVHSFGERLKRIAAWNLKHCLSDR